MNFPIWTRRRGMTKAQRATARLQYLINRLAAEYSAKASIKSLADALDINYSTILIYIQRGKFSEVLALKMERVFGVKADHLMDPLSITDEAL